MIASLKDIIRGQAEELEVLQGKVAQLSREAVLARENQVQVSSRRKSLMNAKLN